MEAGSFWGKDVDHSQGVVRRDSFYCRTSKSARGERMKGGGNETEVLIPVDASRLVRISSFNGR